VISIPSTHPYTRRVLPDEVVSDADPTRPWWPHPALEPEWVTDNVSPGYVVHLHFGFEHRTPDEMAQWTRAVHAAGAALVATVHDVDNPHCTPAQQAEHGRRVAVVLDAADEVLTLTPSAAAEVARRWGRAAQVVAHPHVAAVDHRQRVRGGVEQPVVGVDLKALRPGSLPFEVVLEALGRAARATGASARAWIEDGLPSGSIVAVAAAADQHDVELRVEAPPDDAGLVERFAACDVALLPYRAGTHSGLLELCRDVGARPVVPDHGSYRDQWSEAVTFARCGDGSVTAEALAAAVIQAVKRGPVELDRAGWRAEQLIHIREQHRSAYARALAARCP
jgi:hypothetical protein